MWPMLGFQLGAQTYVLKHGADDGAAADWGGVGLGLGGGVKLQNVGTRALQKLQCFIVVESVKPAKITLRTATAEPTL